MRVEYAVLQRGGSSLEAVEKTTQVLEESPLFYAGKSQSKSDVIVLGTKWYCLMMCKNYSSISCRRLQQINYKKMKILKNTCKFVPKK